MTMVVPPVVTGTQRIACVGTRDLPRYTRGYIVSIGDYFASEGHTILSGNAPGCDQAFALGANTRPKARVELYLPWPSFESQFIMHSDKVHLADEATPEEVELAQLEDQHKSWEQLKDPIKKLFIRDAMMAARCTMVVAFPNLTRPGWGGTGHTIRAARRLGRPVWILQHQTWMQ